MDADARLAGAEGSGDVPHVSRTSATSASATAASSSAQMEVPFPLLDAGAGQVGAQGCGIPRECASFMYLLFLMFAAAQDMCGEGPAHDARALHEGEQVADLRCWAPVAALALAATAVRVLPWRKILGAAGGEGGGWRGCSMDAMQPAAGRRLERRKGAAEEGVGGWGWPGGGARACLAAPPRAAVRHALGEQPVPILKRDEPLRRP